MLYWVQLKRLNVRSARGLQGQEILPLVHTERQRGRWKLCQCVRLPVDKTLFVQRANAGFPRMCSADAI